MNIIKAIDENSKEYDVFLQDVLSRYDDLPAGNDQLEDLQNSIISHVNSRLNQSTTRHDGLRTLIRVLPRCSREILSKHCIFWITKASQTLESGQSGIKELSLACECLALLITVCKDIAELHKHVSMQSVKQLIVAISNLGREKRCGASYRLIGALLYYYREPSERLQTSIRAMILGVVDADEEHLARAGANCYALLARATERSFKAPPTKANYNGWTYGQALLCNSLNAIMDDLFSGLIELESVDAWDKLELADISEDNVIDYYCGVERRFRNLCIYLSTTLRGCGGRNAVSVKDILQVLCRGLAVTPSSLKNDDSFKGQMLRLVLPRLHTSLILVLNALIDGFQEELMPFALTILQLYQQTLKWSEVVGENEGTVSGGKPFTNVRIAVYKSISLWLSRLGRLSGIELFSEEFLAHILKDVTPEKERVLLTVQKNQHLSKRALKRFKDNQYESSTSLGSAKVATKNPRVNAELCKESLRTLENIFFNAGGTLKQSFYKTTQNAIVPLLYDYYLGKMNDNFYEQDDECRLRLLKVLKAIQLNPHPSTAPPTQYSIQVFGMALRDQNLNVVEESRAALAELEKIAHPSSPSLELVRLRNVDNNVDDDTGERELGIRWSRPPVENEKSDDTLQVVEVHSENQSVWERFRDARIEKTGPDGVEEATNGELTEVTIDGPTPSKQQKLAEPGPPPSSPPQEPGEKMDTSEDDLITTTPRKDEGSDGITTTTTTTTTIAETDDQVDQHNKSSSYLTLKEIQGNDSQSGDEVDVDEEKNTTNETSNHSIRNEEKASKDDIADRSDRDVRRCLDDNSDDEAILSLFCDELKDA